MEDNKIKILLLDVGGVLIKLNWKNFFKTLGLKEVVNGVDIRRWFDKDSKHYALEKGLVDFSEFYEDFKSHFSLPITLKDFEKAWNSILEGTHYGVDNLLEEARGGVPLKVLSNTNKVHFDLYSTWGPFKHFDQFFLSFELGVRKPEKEIYKKVLEETKVRPQDILFVDDMEANLKEAKAMGLQAEFCLNSVNDLKNILLKYRII
ncbi:MAG: HAD family phosphatase [Bdellovibrionota bacterium]|nr:HAD family phosphatase [Bdellovibrionota bacterium]